MAFSNLSRLRPVSLPHASLELSRCFGEALDGIGEALCLFDSDDRCLYWNRTFLVLFPEHAGHIYEGEPYRENLRRFYACRLKEQEIPLIDSYIDAGIARHRAQTRPFVFEHHDHQILVTSSRVEDGGRIRIWRADNVHRINDGEVPLNLAGCEAPASVKHMLDQIPDGLMMCGLDGCINWVNKPFVDMYGLPDRTVALGTTFDSVFRLAWSNPNTSTNRVLFETGLETLSENLRFVGASFELPLPANKFVRIIASPTSEQTIIYAHVDITEFKRQQRLLAEAELASRRESERTYYMATHDTMTMLPNRMLSNERLKNSFLNLKRSRVVYAVLVLDIDLFKLINDAHGHAMGDRVLRRLADELQHAVRESDFVARIGGEEFLVLLPATGIDEARLIAEKIRRSVEAMESPSGDTLTVSIGAATASPEDDDEDACVLKADEMLYAAKRAGRNRVMCFGQ